VAEVHKVEEEKKEELDTFIDELGDLDAIKLMSTLNDDQKQRYEKLKKLIRDRKMNADRGITSSGVYLWPRTQQSILCVCACL